MLKSNAKRSGLTLDGSAGSDGANCPWYVASVEKEVIPILTLSLPKSLVLAMYSMTAMTAASSASKIVLALPSRLTSPVQF